MTIKNTEHWLSLIDSFQSAALGTADWSGAIQAMADATGSRGAQLIGRRRDLSVLFNVITNLDPAAQKLAMELQPVNPRPSIVERAPILRAVADWDVLTPEQSARDPFYQEVLRPWDAPFFCATVLERRTDMFVTLGVIRSHADGYITAAQRRTFILLAEHVRAAIRLHTIIAEKGAALFAACMETLSVPLFICDSSGRVRLLTEAATGLVSDKRGLELRDGRLRAALPSESRALDEAITAALAATATVALPRVRTVVIHDATLATAPTVLEILACPAEPGTRLTVSPRVLIVACGERRSEERRAALLGAVYHLTAAEIAIARLLTAGQTAAQIAAQRRASIGTVRVQIKTILGKLGVRRQAELVARVNRL